MARESKVLNEQMDRASASFRVFSLFIRYSSPSGAFGFCCDVHIVAEHLRQHI